MRSRRAEHEILRRQGSLASAVHRNIGIAQAPLLIRCADFRRRSVGPIARAPRRTRFRSGPQVLPSPRRVCRRVAAAVARRSPLRRCWSRAGARGTGACALGQCRRSCKHRGNGQRLSFFACLGALGMRGGTPAWKSTIRPFKPNKSGGAVIGIRLISGALQSDCTWNHKSVLQPILRDGHGSLSSARIRATRWRLLRMRSNLLKHNNLMLRSERRSVSKHGSKRQPISHRQY